jgi:hypothetical protein
MSGDQATTPEEGPAGCAMDPVLSFLALKWLVHIVWLLGRRRSLRFAELRRLLPGRVSAKVLSISQHEQLEESRDLLGTATRGLVSQGKMLSLRSAAAGSYVRARATFSHPRP